MTESLPHLSFEILAFTKEVVGGDTFGQKPFTFYAVRDVICQSFGIKIGLGGLQWQVWYVWPHHPYLFQSKSECESNMRVCGWPLGMGRDKVNTGAAHPGWR